MEISLKNLLVVGVFACASSAIAMEKEGFPASNQVSGSGTGTLASGTPAETKNDLLDNTATGLNLNDQYYSNQTPTPGGGSDTSVAVAVAAKPSLLQRGKEKARTYALTALAFATQCVKSPTTKAAGISLLGAGLWSSLDHPEVVRLLEKIGVSKLEAAINILVFTTLLSTKAAGIEKAGKLAKLYAIIEVLSKIYASDTAQKAISYIPVIGDQLVSQETLARIDNNQVTVQEKGATAVKTALGLAIFAGIQKLATKYPKLRLN